MSCINVQLVSNSTTLSVQRRNQFTLLKVMNYFRYWLMNNFIFIKIIALQLQMLHFRVEHQFQASKYFYNFVWSKSKLVQKLYIFCF